MTTKNLQELLAIAVKARDNPRPKGPMIIDPMQGYSERVAFDQALPEMLAVLLQRIGSDRRETAIKSQKRVHLDRNGFGVRFDDDD